MREAVIVDAVRTPIGRRGGGLAGTHPVDLGAVVLNGLAERTGLDPAQVDDIVWGCVSTAGEQSSNIARWTGLAAGWPESVPGTTVDRACGSSQQAVTFAAAAVMAGQCDVVVAGGVESMTRVPMGSTRALGPGEPRGPRVVARYPGTEFNQGEAAELIADKWGFSRTQLDEFSLASHEKAARAQDERRFDDQILPVITEHGTVSADEGVRRGGSLETLAGLKPAFRENGRVTAANSSQISDGASALLITTPEVAAANGWRPLARFHSFALTGIDPVLMLTGPISATDKLLQRAHVALEEIGTFEVNEAFASVTLAWLAETGADPALLNPDGGAVALGHPLGCSGARLATTMVHRMRREGIRYGLQTICEAGGMANAMLLENLEPTR
jgi:acetyl-CoA acyltransferase